MTCLQSASTSVASLLIVAVLLLSSGGYALLAWAIGKRSWEFYRHKPGAEGSPARARRLLSGVAWLTIVGLNLAAAWNHCSLDNKVWPAGGWGIYVANIAMLYYISRPPPRPYSSRHPYLSTVPGMVSRMVRDRPRRSLVVFLGGVLTAAVPLLLLLLLVRVTQAAFLPLLLGWMVLFLVESVLALRWLRRDVRRTHEQGFSGFLWPVHLPGTFWIWAWGFGPTLVIGLVVLVLGWGR